MLIPKIQSEILYAHFSAGKSTQIAQDFEINRKSVYRVIKRGKGLIEKSYAERGSIIDDYLGEIVLIMLALDIWSDWCSVSLTETFETLDDYNWRQFIEALHVLSQVYV